SRKRPGRFPRSHASQPLRTISTFSCDIARPGSPLPASRVISAVRARALLPLALVGALAGCQESGFDESKETQRPLKVQDAMNPLTGTQVPGQAERPPTLTHA